MIGKSIHSVKRSFLQKNVRGFLCSPNGTPHWHRTLITNRMFSNYRDTWTPKTPLKHEKVRRILFPPTMKINGNEMERTPDLQVLIQCQSKEITNLTKKMFIDNVRNKLKMARCGNRYIPMKKQWFPSGDVGWHGSLRKKTYLGNAPMDVLYAVDAVVINSNQWDEGQPVTEMKERFGSATIPVEIRNQEKGALYPSFMSSSDDCNCMVQYGVHEIPLRPQRLESGDNGWAGTKEISQKIQGRTYRLQVNVNVTIEERKG